MKSACRWCDAGLPISSETVTMHVRWTWQGEPTDKAVGKGATAYPWKYKELLPCGRAFPKLNSGSLEGRDG